MANRPLVRRSPRGRITFLAFLCTAASLFAVAVSLPALAAANTEGIISEPFNPHDPQVNSGWQAGTCSKEKAETGSYCSVATPNQFFEQAAGHPNFGFTQFIIKHTTTGTPPLQFETPTGELKTVRVDLPVGLSVNPGATIQCTQEKFDANACPPESEVGVSEVTVSVGGIVVGPIEGVTSVPVYNVVPGDGESARFGLMLAGKPVYLEGDVDSAGDYHEGFTIHVPEAIPVEIGSGVILKNRLTFKGRAGDGTFLTTPSTCRGEAFKESGSDYSTFLLAASKAEEESAGYSFPGSAQPPLESPIPPGTSPKECGSIPYAPEVDVDPGTGATNSPAAASVGVTVPHIKKGSAQESSTTKAATVTLPGGMGLNPSAANGLQTCTDAQFGKGTKAPVGCPAASKVGTVKIESFALPEKEHQLEGTVYVGSQLSRDPASGQEYRIFIDAASPRYGIDLRLVGNVRANPATGQLATTISETPQLPFSSFVLNFNGGPRSVLSSPPICGPNQTTTSLQPWSGNPPATPSSSFALKTLPAGGSCPKTLAERPFAPGFLFGPKSTGAGVFTPLSTRITRADGQQELKGIELLLPPGVTAKLAGIPYCTAAQIAAAAAKSGAEEAKTPSCPAKSEVGKAAITAGTGSAPYAISNGRAYLAGPYKGAPLSLAVITPAVAGPFDLGTVVVRVALFVEPETAQVRAVSDPIPDVYGGAQLSLRSIDLTLDRKEFSLNPTSCDLFQATGAVRGGGADPANPATYSAAPIRFPFQTTGCDGLKFRPQLTTKVLGGKKKLRRAGHPRLQAVLRARAGDANIARAALTLPHSIFLDQAHIGTICTRPQLAANNCPARSVYGYASAKSPLLDDELKGPVYLVSSDHELPDLLADLQGQVDIRLRGVISNTKKGERTKTVFATVPDVPVSEFRLTMNGGKRGLLVNSRNMCGKPGASYLNFRGQNGKKLKKKKLKLHVPSCKKHKGKGKKHSAAK